MGLKRFLILASACIFLGGVALTKAQTLGSLQCGDIVEGEIVAGQSKTVTSPRGNQISVDDYSLAIRAGTRVDLKIEPLGETFNVGLALLDSGGNDVALFNDGGDGEPETLIDYRIASSNQVIRILGVRPDSMLGVEYFYWESVNASRTTPYAGTFFGAYRIELGCIVDGGTVIPPDATSVNATLTPEFSGYGFPGLPPIDFANVARIPLIANTPMTGAVTPTGSEILGYTLDANAGDKLDLSFARLSGNLNLGLVVLSAENQVVFQASLVTSETMSTRLTLPNTGQYTIGVFRIDLLPPAAPEATAFQVQGTLNP